MADPGAAGERLLQQPRLQVPELALSAPALQVAVLDGASNLGGPDDGAVIVVVTLAPKTAPTAMIEVGTIRIPLRHFVGDL